MRQQKKRYLLAAFLALLFVGIGFLGYTTAQTPVAEQQAKNKVAKLAIKEKNISIQGAITHVHEPDDSSITIIDIVIGNEFMGTLPDDIDTITVTRPKGDLSLAKEDFNYYPQFRNKLFGKSDNDEIKVELYPETASQFYGKSPDIGGFKLKFVKNREGDINQFVLHCAPQFAFMSIPFEKIKWVLKRFRFSHRKNRSSLLEGKESIFVR